jgi:hypothetical protein
MKGKRSPRDTIIEMEVVVPTQRCTMILPGSSVCKRSSSWATLKSSTDLAKVDYYLTGILDSLALASHEQPICKPHQTNVPLSFKLRKIVVHGCGGS